MSRRQRGTAEVDGVFAVAIKAFARLKRTQSRCPIVNYTSKASCSIFNGCEATHKVSESCT